MGTVTVSADEVRGTVDMVAAIGAVRQAFLGLARGEFDLPVRVALGEGGLLVMPAFHRPSGTGIVKVLSVNLARDPAIAGSVVWSAPDGVDQLVADAGAVTALRTGAVVGVATDLLAPSSACQLALIGAGAQSADQVRAVCAVRPVRQVAVVDRDAARAETIAALLSAELPGVRFDVLDDAEDAVAGSDIVCCATSSTRPLFRAECLPEQVHVNAIGSYRPTMRELPDAVFSGATVVVDQREAALEEAGEIISAVAAGTLAVAALHDLGQALSGGTPTGRRTIFKSVGVAVQDWAIARLLADTLMPGATTR